MKGRTCERTQAVRLRALVQLLQGIGRGSPARAAPYERIPVDIFAGETLTNEYAQKNPTRTTPLLELPDGRFLPESAAILVYLAEGTELWPDDAFDRAQVLRWLVYEQTDVIPATGGLRFRLITDRLAPDDADAQRRRTAGQEVLCAS